VAHYEGTRIRSFLMYTYDWTASPACLTFAYILRTGTHIRKHWIDIIIIVIHIRRRLCDDQCDDVCARNRRCKCRLVPCTAVLDRTNNVGYCTARHRLLLVLCVSACVSYCSRESMSAVVCQGRCLQGRRQN